jgi:hypothetical protein
MALEFMEARGVARGMGGVSLGVKLRDACRMSVGVRTMGMIVTGALAAVDVNVIMCVAVVWDKHAAIVIAC